MIDVAAAIDKLKQSAPRPIPVRVALPDALGSRLSKDISAPLSMPLFDQSAVDGYVLMNGPFGGEELFEVTGEIKAGDPAPRPAKRPVAYRIFTGAPVPKKAWCVVMQERVTLQEGAVHVPSEWQSHGANIRSKGSHFRKKDLLLKKGELLTPAAIGLLASVGISSVEVFSRPRIGVVVTGNELTSPHKPLRPGKIFDSNSYFLAAALEASSFESVLIRSAVDSRKALDEVLRKAIGKCDVIILTGGISVGKYDLVYEALRSAGVRELFYKVAQKPGKPLFAGKKGRKLFFALPGNPAAVAVCFHRYVLPTLQVMSGQPSAFEGAFRLPLNSDYELKGDRDLFLRAFCVDNAVQLLSGQDSDNLFTFAQANALVYLSREQHFYRKGDMVEVIRL
jgi:molybdopterin molybdotransferase